MSKEITLKIENLADGYDRYTEELWSRLTEQFPDAAVDVRLTNDSSTTDVTGFDDNEGVREEVENTARLVSEHGAWHNA